MFTNLFIFGTALYLVIRGAIHSSQYALSFAKEFKMSTYLVGLIIVSFISILPETFISVSSLFAWEPSLWIWTLFWSNLADLTLVFAILILFSWRSVIKVSKWILTDNKLYTIFLLAPVVLWIDWDFTRTEWIVLLSLWFLYYYNTVFRRAKERTLIHWTINRKKIAHIWGYLLFNIALLLLWAHFIVVSGISIAEYLWVNPVIIGIWVVWLGTVIPELLFAFQAVKHYEDEIVIGDLLWTVLSDATIVIWVMALILPFTFPSQVAYVTWVFMVWWWLLNNYFAKTEKSFNKQEWVLLLLFWIVFIAVEYFVNS